VSPRTTTLGLALLALATLPGCDDVVLFDVAADGSVLVAADAAGLVPVNGDGKSPRHLLRVDPKTRTVTRLTKEPRVLSWPQACRDGVVFVEARKSLVRLHRDGREETLLESTSGLYNPRVSRDGSMATVLEADRLGVPGTLHVLRLADGSTDRTVSNALLGAAWAADGSLLVPVRRSAQRKPFATGVGAVSRLGEDSTRELYRGSLPTTALLTPVTKGRLFGLLHRGGDEGPLGIAQLAPGGPRPGTARGFAFWPTVDASGARLLFTLSDAENPKLHGELRVAPYDGVSASRVVSTATPVAAPRWIDATQIAYLTPEHHLTLQDLDGNGRVDLTDDLRAAFSQEPQ
jgi:hypothetical protein